MEVGLALNKRDLPLFATTFEWVVLGLPFSALLDGRKTLFAFDFSSVDVVFDALVCVVFDALVAITGAEAGRTLDARRCSRTYMESA